METSIHRPLHQPSHFQQHGKTLKFLLIFLLILLFFLSAHDHGGTAAESASMFDGPVNLPRGASNNCKRLIV